VLKRFIVQYRVPGGRKPREVLAKVELGQDPAADKRDRRNKDKLSLRSQVKAYLAVKAKEVRSKPFREITRYLTGQYFKPLHAVAIDMIRRKDLASRLGAIGREHGDTVAKKARDTISAFFLWSLEEGLRESNPVIGTRKLKDKPPRDRVLSSPS
jgi:hypothetical protein